MSDSLKNQNTKKNNNVHIIKNINSQIDAMLNNNDEVREEKKSKTKLKIKNLNNNNNVDFKTLIKEIDNYKNQVHEGFDEVKYLIELGERTHIIIDKYIIKIVLISKKMIILIKKLILIELLILI